MLMWTLDPENPPGLRATLNSLKTTRSLECTSTPRTVERLHHTSSRTWSLLLHLQVISLCAVLRVEDFDSLSHRPRKKGLISQKVEQIFFLFFFEVSSDKNFEQSCRVVECVCVGGGEARSKACKFLMNRTNKPRGPRRGGEKGASFLN